MLLAAASIVIGLGLLVWGADRFAVGAASLARNLGVSPLLIGLTVVGFGTSAPEILVSTMAALQGNPGLAIGNAIGSNIANIGLILGAMALIAPLTVRSDMVRREYPLLLAVSVGTFLLLLGNDLDRFDGIALLLGLVVSMWLFVRIGLQRRENDPLTAEIEAEIPLDIGGVAGTGWFLLGLATLIISSHLLVWGAVEVATGLGVSDLVIGLTLALFVMGRSTKSHGTINRAEGAMLLACFLACQGWIAWRSPALPA